MPVKDLKDLYNIHKGKPLIIAGNGPTIMDVPFDKLSGIPKLSCNSQAWRTEAYSVSEGKFVENKLIPDYMVFSEDQTVFEPRSKECKILFAENGCNLGKFSEFVKSNDFYKFQVNRKYVQESLSMAEHTNWKANLRSVCPAITGAHNNSFYMAFGGLSTAINIAFWLGASSIYLCGFEGRPVDGRYHFWEKPEDKSSIYDSNAAMAQRVFNGQMKYLYVCRQIMEQCGVKLYCSTKNSKYLKALEYAELPV